MQSLTNTGVAAAISAGLFLIGMPYALLFGALGGVLRFIPYVGIWAAAGSTALVSVAVFDGWREPLLVVALFALVELIVYFAVEPLLYSHSVGVSPLALLITLAFWTWLWGPIGLILGTPLTVCLVALGRHVPELQFIMVLFGDEPVVTADVAVYQRLLKDDEVGARGVLKDYLKTHTAADLDGAVLLPALARVRRDAARGALSAHEAASIAAVIDRLVADLEGDARRAARAREGEPTPAAVPSASPLEAFACPARDAVDAAALRLLASRLASDGVHVTPAEPGLLAAEIVERVAATEPGVVVVSLAEVDVGHARYVLKRLRARLPDVPVVAACWGAPSRLDAMCALLLDAGATDVASTLEDTRARGSCSTAASRRNPRRPARRDGGARGGRAQRGSRRRKAAMARPISAGESSCTRWLPRTVTSCWFGQRRQNSRCAPTRMEPGSALTKSLGSRLAASHSA